MCGGVSINLMATSVVRCLLKIASTHYVSKIVSLTNLAFSKDAFFKREEYHNRFTEEDVLEMMTTEENGCFLIAIKEEDGEEDNDEVYGSLYLKWNKEGKDKLVGHFSAVSVNPLYEKRGIGGQLIKAAEDKLRTVALEFACRLIVIEMGVINQRADLFPWYMKQGFKIIGEIRDDPELARIILPKMDVYLVLMSKEVL